MASPPEAESGTTILLCVATRGRNDVTLTCAISLLRLQILFMTLPQRYKADLHFVQSLDEALNLLHRHPTAAGALTVDCSVGFDPEFVVRAHASGLPVVVGSYPLPAVDWERVKTAPERENCQFWGNVYNARPSGRIDHCGYAHVLEAKLGVSWIRKRVVDDIVAAHPELVAADGTLAVAVEGLYDGKRLTADERFLSLFGGEVWADIERPATSTGPVEFGGCVGQRAVLR